MGAGCGVRRALCRMAPAVQARMLRQGRITDRRQHSSPEEQPQGDGGEGKETRRAGMPTGRGPERGHEKRAGSPPPFRFVLSA